MPPFALRRARTLVGLALMLVPACIALVMAYQQRWLDDDGFINLRIARNVLEGHGPVFNLDERVEAGTSPLWLLLVTLLGALGARLEDASVYTGIALTALAVLVAQDAASRLHAPEGSSFPERLGLGWLPLGALSVAVLPPIWDYASSGLETGLSLFWLACAYDVLATRLTRDESELATPQAVWKQLACALWLGLGILIRPELTLYALTFFALFLLLIARTLPDRKSQVLRALALLVVFGALPVGYQIFRMGYYGALSPNTAIAKEAFLVNWDQGRCYLRNYVGTYKLTLPLSTLALLLVWLVRGQALSRSTLNRLLWLGVLLAPPALGLFHAAYVVRMGGDYMHARMFLPATFAALLPVAVVPVFGQRGSGTASALVVRFGHVLLAGCTAVVLGWCLLCARSLRVPVENECGIGDERGWYARMAEVQNPVRIEEYEKHPFHLWGRGLVDTIRKSCPELDTASAGSQTPGCRLTHLTPDEAREVSPVRLSYQLSPKVDARVVGQISQGAMGIAGLLLPDTVHLFDVHGLADPFVSRALLHGRGRPGHEKTMPVAWRLARFAAPTPGEDASISAARHALRCGSLATLEQAVRAPLDATQFLQNVTHASQHTRMRIPRDPFVAESRYCGTPPMTTFITAGEGGDAFHFVCPKPLGLTGIRGTFSTPAAGVARVVGSCSDVSGSTQPPVLGPAFGPDADAPFSLLCPVGSRVVGIFGSANAVVHGLGLLCSAQDEPTRTETIGVPVGEPFEFLCPKGQSVRMLRGRAGALLDGLGIGCRVE